MKSASLSILPLILGASVFIGCSSEADTSAKADHEQEAVEAMHASISTDLADFLAAVKDLQAAAPTPTGRGWDATEDAASIAQMKDAWVKARVAYEHVEGALAPLFPDLDFAVDARYDDYLAELGPDDNLFDAEGVTGLHGAERVIFADKITAEVTAMESSLVGYKAAAFPATEAEAKEFKEKLLGRLITDVETLEGEWTPAAIDLAGAFGGLIDLMGEQKEKVNKAGDEEEESRYSQRTMADLRANLEGTRKIYLVFQPWLKTKQSSDPALDGATIDAAVIKGFDDLKATYDAIQGDAFPPVPVTWSAEAPSAEDLASAFGKLHSAVSVAVDPEKEGSLAFAMNQASKALGL